MEYHPYGCPIRFSASVLGDRWNLVIIRDLMFKGRKYFGDFINAGEGISTNILSNRLQRLEESGVIDKSIDPDHGKKYIYTLTEKGEALLPVLLQMMTWAANFDDQTEMPPAFVKKLRHDPETLAEEVLDKIHSR